LASALGASQAPLQSTPIKTSSLKAGILAIFRGCSFWAANPFHEASSRKGDTLRPTRVLVALRSTRCLFGAPTPKRSSPSRGRGPSVIPHASSRSGCPGLRPRVSPPPSPLRRGLSHAPPSRGTTLPGSVPRCSPLAPWNRVPARDSSSRYTDRRARLKSKPPEESHRWLEPSYSLAYKQLGTPAPSIFRGGLYTYSIESKYTLRARFASELIS